ncbi:MAG: protein kinase [Hyphomonadaceae bacterium]|nr:protein kinase [Hyphomonadaceae bacterium]
MDEIRAKNLETELKGKSIDGWLIESYINCGKSAAVFKAHNGDRSAAIKIFDDELIKQYGGETQFSRIARELTLIGDRHPNMVSILGGGVDPNTKNHYVAMELLDGPNLASCIDKVPAENIAGLIEQLALAAEFLETKNLCHRDIKPENIILTNEYSHLTLLDFGVLRPIGVSGLTDGENLRAFIGTLRYSSPEFLLRTEDDSILGWRALTFYQIGGVLHDLIMRKPLFFEFSSPYAALVNAVQNEVPNIQSSTASPQLAELAARCLLKDWKVRTKLVEWSHFKLPATADTSISSAKQRVTNRTALAKAQATQNSPGKTKTPKAYDVQAETIETLKMSVRSIRRDNDIFPPVMVSQASGKKPVLKIYFEAAPKLGWTKTVVFQLRIDVLEIPSKAIKISSHVHIGKIKSDDQPTLDSIQVFAGVLNTTAIREALENYIYHVIDVVQQKSDSLGDGWLNHDSSGSGGI